MPIKPKDSRLIGWGRVKPRPQRLPKKPPMPLGVQIGHDETTGAQVSYNPPAALMNPLVTPTPFLPQHLRALGVSNYEHKIPSQPKKKEQKFLSSAEIEQIRQMRAEGSSRREIADKLSTTEFFVSLVAPLAKEDRLAALAREEEIKSRWTPRKQAYREIRSIKRATWGQ